MNRAYELIKLNPYEDSRGKLSKLAAKSKLEKEETIEEVYIIYTNKGAVRGNHYHKKTVEYFSVLSGTAAISIKDMQTGVTENIAVSADDNIVLKIPAYTAHAFKNEEEQQLIIAAVSMKEYSINDTDTYKEELLL